MRQAGGQVALGGVVGHGAQGIVRVQTGGDGAPAPGAAEVQSVQVGDLAIGAVADRGWGEQGGGQAGGGVRQEGREPGPERGGVEEPAHGLRLDQGRRQEVVAGRLPGLAALVRAVPALGLVTQQAGEARILGHLRIFGGQGQGEGGGGVDPRAHRIGGLGQEVAEPVGEGGGQGGVGDGPGRVLAEQFGLQHQEPCPAIGSLEPPGPGPFQIGALALHLVRGEGGVEQGVDLRGLRDLRMAPPQGGQQPVAVHAGMPVIAAEEDRMQHLGLGHVARAGEGVDDHVGIFPGHMAQGDPREVRGDLRGEGGRRGHTSGPC